MNGEELSLLRLRYRINKKELSKMTGITTRSIFSWENGKEIPQKCQIVLQSVFNKLAEERGAELKDELKSISAEVIQQRALFDEKNTTTQNVTNQSCNISQQTVANKVETPKVSDKMAEDLETLTEQINALAKQVETYRAIIDVKDEQISKLIDLLSKR